MELNKDRIDFEEITSEIINNLKFQEYAGAITVQKQINQAIPFYSDKNRVETIIGNLLSNAYKYHRFESNNPYINIQIDTFERNVCIIISDNGAGIAEEYQDKVFDMFFRASEKSQGSGLGLYIVKSAVDKLQGTVELESRIGEGTTFKINIPNIILAEKKHVGSEVI